MYALVIDNEIVKHFQFPKGFELNGNQYSADVFTKWSSEERQAIGIYEVITDSTNKKDEQYYINTNEQFTFADGQVTRSWGTATAKELEDRNATDENGVELDPVVVIKGLKSQKKNIIKQQASDLLEQTDWYNHKALDDDTYTIPDNIKTYRANVRAKSNEMETQIDACTNVDELKALYEYTEQEDGSITRPLAEFPTLEI
jgi:hypothetical protein